MSVSGKVVVVTGAGSGIGQALARGFAADGAHVVAFDRAVEGLRVTADGRSLLTVEGDVTTAAGVARLVETALEQHGQIDVLINNAGIADHGAFLEISFEDWARVIEVNLIGLARCTRAVLPGMVARGHGRVINLASRAAESKAGRPAYSASKAAVVSFTKTLAAEVRRAGAEDVLVNALIPGPTNTAIWDTPHPEMQSAETVYPHARFIVELPAGGPNGRAFFNSADYAVFTRFNEP